MPFSWNCLLSRDHCSLSSLSHFHSHSPLGNTHTHSQTERLVYTCRISLPIPKRAPEPSEPYWGRKEEKEGGGVVVEGNSQQANKQTNKHRRASTRSSSWWWWYAERTTYFYFGVRLSALLLSAARLINYQNMTTVSEWKNNNCLWTGQDSTEAVVCFDLIFCSAAVKKSLPRSVSQSVSAESSAPLRS